MICIINNEVTNKIDQNFKKLSQVKATDFPGTYSGYDDAWDTKKFKKVVTMKDIIWKLKKLLSILTLLFWILIYIINNIHKS